MSAGKKFHEICNCFWRNGFENCRYGAFRAVGAGVREFRGIFAAQFTGRMNFPENGMNKLLLLLLCLPAGFAGLRAQTTEADGDWSKNAVTLTNTREADVMIRVGDIDNLNFGWAEGFDPFTGRQTDVHSFPWETDKTDVPGLDRILIGSGFERRSIECGSDGYSGVGREGTRPVPIVLPLARAKGVQITGATLTMFIDDFQAPTYCSKFRAYLNGRRFADLERTLNMIDQGGPVGKFITARLTPDLLPLLQADKLSVLIDDSTSGARDGYAIDFVKLLINPKPSLYKGVVTGEVRDSTTQEPIAGARVDVRGYAQTLTDAEGKFTLNDVPVGVNFAEASARGYRNNGAVFDVIADETAEPRILYLAKAKGLDFGGAQLQAGDAITLNNIQFAQSSAELTKQSVAELDKVAALMRQYPRIEIELSGHTSAEGSPEGNRMLSQARVQSCKNYLVRQGIDEARIAAVGYGPDKPAAPNDTEANRSKNRRVEMKILKM